jgi:hypothetical protein
LSPATDPTNTVAGLSISAGQQAGELRHEQQFTGSITGSGWSGVMSSPVGCWRHGSILRQTQVALTTWAHLKTHASSPSTVIAQPAQAVSTPMACTESSTA